MDVTREITREEAIANLNMISVAFVEPVTKEQRKLIDDTFDMAIKALEQEPCEDAIRRQAVLDGLASIAKAKAKSDAQKSLMGRVMFFVEQLPSVNPQPCEDAIRRQDVLDLAKKGVLVSNGNYKSVCKAINEIPSVTQKSDNKYRKKAKRWKNKWLKSQKSGKWMEHGFLGDIWFECSRCDCDSDSSYNYCPNCGARMIESEEV